MKQEREPHRWRIVTSVLIAGLLAAGPALGEDITGQWDFTSGLSATVGHDLQYGGGASGYTAIHTVFGKTSAFNIPTVVPTDALGAATGPAVNADIMNFPQMPSSADGYKVWPGAHANGSTSDVNQYTLVMDIYYPAASTGVYRGLWQTSASNSNDADFWVGDTTVKNANGDPRPNGIGVNGVYDGEIKPDTWYRVALVVDLEAPDGSPDYLKYINGQFVGGQDVDDPGGRFSAYSEESGTNSWLLADNDGETALGYADHIQFWGRSLSGAEVGALGGIANGPIVPEPATLSLLALGSLALLHRRRS